MKNFLHYSAASKSRTRAARDWSAFIYSASGNRRTTSKCPAHVRGRIQRLTRGGARIITPCASSRSYPCSQKCETPPWGTACGSPARLLCSPPRPGFLVRNTATDTPPASTAAAAPVGTPAFMRWTNGQLSPFKVALKQMLSAAKEARRKDEFTRR